MITSANGRRLIEQFEGLSLRTYNDGTGVLTIGYGHTSAAGLPKVTRGQTITRDQADQILASDLSEVESDVNRLVKVQLNQNQFDALVSFQFNTGALARSTVLRLLNKGDYNGAASALLAYNRAGGRVLAGLQRRREAEKELFLSRPVVPVPAATASSIGVVAYMHDHPWYILGSIILAGIVVDLLIHLYRKGKQ